MSKLDELSFEEQVALEGELSKLFFSSPSMAEATYKAYCVLKKSKEEYRDYILEAMLKIAPLSEETLQKIIIEIRMNTVPKWIWYDKCIQDIKDSLFAINMYKDNSSVACLDKSEAKNNIVRSCFMAFYKNTTLEFPREMATLCKRIIKDEKELDFLIPACYIMLDELKKIKTPNLSEKKKFNLMEALFNPSEMLSFDTEIKLGQIPKEKKAEVQKRIKEELENPETTGQIIIREVRIAGGTSKDKEEALGHLANFFGDPSAELGLEPECYIVKKVFKGSRISKVMRAFPTRKEAEEFVEDIEKNYPELLNTCDFEIYMKRGNE